VLLCNIHDSIEFVLNVLKVCNFGLGLFKIQTTGVVGIELGEFATLCIALGEELIVVEGAIISWHAIEVAHVLGLGTFLVGEEGLVHFLAVADADDLDVFLLTSEKFAYGFGLSLDSTCRSFLNKYITVLAMFEGEEDEIDSSSSDMLKRVILGSVRVMGLPWRIWSIQRGMTEPREHITLP